MNKSNLLKFITEVFCLERGVNIQHFNNQLVKFFSKNRWLRRVIR
jgi:hypothetical protein